uniref:Uncharacterized protein n=1 Tax=Timema cristinae TaxID=61476 RepID=A0A7R9GYB8_TIMCR|nr:unnamed protein product [Timema cristinae]
MGEDGFYENVSAFVIREDFIALINFGMRKTVTVSRVEAWSGVVGVVNTGPVEFLHEPVVEKKANSLQIHSPTSQGQLVTFTCMTRRGVYVEETRDVTFFSVTWNLTCTFRNRLIISAHHLKTNCAHSLGPSSLGYSSSDPRESPLLGNVFGLVVGAPRANSTLQNHLNIYQPGVTYQCDLSQDNKCSQIVLDPTGKLYQWTGH